jgi:hypothetical protein
MLHVGPRRLVGCSVEQMSQVAPIQPIHTTRQSSALEPVNATPHTAGALSIACEFLTHLL